jgi:hypothetical protein
VTKIAQNVAKDLLMSKLKHNLNCLKSGPKIVGYLCNFHSICPKVTITHWILFQSGHSACLLSFFKKEKRKIAHCKWTVKNG